MRDYISTMCFFLSNKREKCTLDLFPPQGIIMRVCGSRGAYVYVSYSKAQCECLW